MNGGITIEGAKKIIRNIINVVKLCGHNSGELLKKSRIIFNNRFIKALRSIFVFFIIQIGIFCTAGIFMIYYGPFTNLKELIVTSAMTTMNHQYIAKAFLSEKEIGEIMEKNKIDNSNKYSDESAIEVSGSVMDKDKSGRDEEKKIEMDRIDFYDISNTRFKGYMLVVNDPGRIGIGSSKQVGNIGMKLDDIVKQYDAIGGINAGGFMDENGKGNGGTPIGVLIENGKIKYGENNIKYDVIGFNEDSVMILGQYTLQEMKAKKIRDAVTFSPFLIVNGEPMIKGGNGGWGIAPRTAIGQRKDGSVLMLVIDGRQVSSVGATLKEVQDIMLEFGAFNAANLDGGSSTTMVYDGRIVNNPCSQYGPRYLPSSFIIK